MGRVGNVALEKWATRALKRVVLPVHWAPMMYMFFGIFFFSVFGCVE